MKNCWFFCVVLLSPSSRAEWVEICHSQRHICLFRGLRPRGRSGLKYKLQQLWELWLIRSPSSRAEWVEMSMYVFSLPSCASSPSSRAEWVEMYSSMTLKNSLALSPSSRAEWVEIRGGRPYKSEPSQSPSSRAEWLFLSGQSPPSQRSKLRIRQIQDYV